MRKLGDLDERNARRFGEVLLANGIANEIDPAAGGACAVWAISEDAVVRGRELFARFTASPEAPEWDDAAVAARARHQQTLTDEARGAEHLREPARSWQGGTRARLTWALIVVSVGITLACGFGQARDVYTWFTIDGIADQDALRGAEFADVRHGQVWRLVTPIFVHMSGTHLLFNMMWLHLLGRMIESRQGWKLLAVLVSVLAVVSDCAQYLFVGPSFGGMSGVVYGLFGYVLIRGSLDRAMGYRLGTLNIVMMLAWFVFCTTGAVGPIANHAHAAGLIVGMGWGAISSPRIWSMFFKTG